MRGPPRGNFVKKTQILCELGTLGTCLLIFSHRILWFTCRKLSCHEPSVPDSRVESSVSQTRTKVKDLTGPGCFYYGFARSRWTTLFEKWYGHGSISRSRCYGPVSTGKSRSLSMGFYVCVCVLSKSRALLTSSGYAVPAGNMLVMVPLSIRGQGSLCNAVRSTTQHNTHTHHC